MPSRAVSEPDPDGFVKVQTIRYKPQPLPNQNSKKNRRNKRQEPEAHLASASDRLASLRDAVQAKTLTLTDGSWGTAWLAFVSDPSGPFGTDSPLLESQSILCLGLGSLESSRIAQSQLSLLLDLKDRLKVTSVRAYDPAFGELDRLLLESYQIEVLSENTHGRHLLEGATLVYMPHCPRTLYQNLLETNWSAAGLSGLTLLANDLEGYLTREPLKKLQSSAPCLPLIVPYLTIHPLPAEYHSNDVFNDLAFQYLTLDAVSRLGQGRGWEPPLALEEVLPDQEEMI